MQQNSWRPGLRSRKPPSWWRGTVSPFSKNPCPGSALPASGFGSSVLASPPQGWFRFDATAYRDYARWRPFENLEATDSRVTKSQGIMVTIIHPINYLRALYIQQGISHLVRFRLLHSLIMTYRVYVAGKIRTGERLLYGHLFSFTHGGCRWCNIF